MSESAVAAAVGQQREERETSSASAAAAAAAPPGFRALTLKVTPWKRDSTKCYTCGVKFTWFNHRHMCRNCQEFVCHSCSLSKKVLRAYTAPKRVCDPCVMKYWTPKTMPEELSALSSNTETTAGLTTKDDGRLGLRPSLTVATEGCPMDGYGPSTAPMSVSPSTPMFEGAFFAAGSKENGEQDDTTSGISDGNRRASGPMLSPSLLASMPEEVEELEEVVPAERTEPAGVVASPPGTSETLLYHDKDDKENSAEVTHDPCEDGAAGAVLSSKMTLPAEVAPPAEAVLPAEVALPVDSVPTSDDEVEMLLPSDVAACHVALPAGPEVVAAAADTTPDVATADTDHDESDASHGDLPSDEGRDGSLASVVPEDVVNADQKGPSTGRSAVVGKATAIAPEQDKSSAPVPELISFAAGLVWGIVAVALGYGMAQLIKIL